MRIRAVAAGIVLALGVAGPASAGAVRVAVAANFADTLDTLAAAFEADTGHEVVASAGATGALYAQITQGAPFDVFLAADERRPSQAIAAGLAVPGTQFTYARGRLALYSTVLDVSDGAGVLAAAEFHHLAIADPHSAPYGAAAVAVIEGLGLGEALASRRVSGENITQTLQFIETGNAELGFVALSQVIGKPGSQWLPPEDLYPPIVQDAVLLEAGVGNVAARDFLAFLKSGEASAIIAAAGYTGGG